jgi:hypothetical protein
MPTPEELARVNIDKQLIACGWVIQDMAGLKRGRHPDDYGITILILVTPRQDERAKNKNY